MSTTIREFPRRVAAFLKAVRAGKVVSEWERDGPEYAFALKRSAPWRLAEAVAHVTGVAETGQLRKTLSGYGRG